MDTTPEGENLVSPTVSASKPKRIIEQMNTLYMHLTNMSPVELRKALPVASPDQLLNTLMQDFNRGTEGIRIGGNYGAEHPEVKRVRHVSETIEDQVTSRLQGIMAGINAKTAASKAKLERFETEAATLERNR